ncbi:MAG: hypothetical protein GYA62_16430 [Bacteroidales bacterium]|nr:hypothetical protein [Bacteroidales bacterium]
MGSLILTLILYIPLNFKSAGLLVFKPFWFLETMMGLSDRLGWQKYYSAMMTYKSGGIYFKEILAYGLAFVIFVVGNFWTRLTFVFRKFKISWIDVFIYSIIFAGVFIPLLFLQSGTPWNTIQFFYYSLFFASVIGWAAISQMQNKIPFIFIIVLLTIPTTLLALKDVYIPSRPPAKLSVGEYKALKFLSEQPKGVVLTKPFDDYQSRLA